MLNNIIYVSFKFKYIRMNNVLRDSRVCAIPTLFQRITALREAALILGPDDGNGAPTERTLSHLKLPIGELISPITVHPDLGAFATERDSSPTLVFTVHCSPR